MKDNRPALSKKYDIAWIKSDRFERRGRFTLNGSAEDVFPLLCPVLEYAWLPGWKCRMASSDSGVAENNCTFFTREAPGRNALWNCIAYKPPAFIEYLVTSGRDAVMRLSIRLAETGRGRTEVDWRMLFTAISPLARAVLKRRFSRANFERLIRDRERELNWYLEHGTMIGKENHG